MKILCCYAALLLFTITSFGQKTEAYYDYNWKPCAPEKARYYTLIQKRDSLWYHTDYYLREKLAQMQGSYRDAENKIAHGRFTYYHPNKQVQGMGEYVDGKREGLWLWFYENGMMSDSSHFTNGELTGTALRWHTDDMIKDSMVMNGDGSGLHVSWFGYGKHRPGGQAREH